MAERSLNKCEFIGRLGKDAETKFTPSGVAVTNFSIACSESWKDKQSGEQKEKTEWVNCVLWRAENLANFLTKGSRVYVAGKLSTRSWEAQDGSKRYATEVVVDEVILLGSKDGSGSGGNKASKPVSNDFGGTLTDDDVPF